jgi:hypothetical protein
LADSLIELEEKAKQFYTDESVDANKIFWHKNVFESPDSLNFWFDFLDSTGEL